MFKLAIICGGPSKERGISLNSARSFLDHSIPLGIDLIPLYVDQDMHFYRLTTAQLYSNTPSDFDFKLKQIAIPLNEIELVSLLKEIDLVFPLIHGVYGEDGTLQAFLEQHDIPFVGSSSKVCKEIFNKQTARERLKKEGFSTLPSLHITSPTTPVESFWIENQLSFAIVKPTLSGSSIGVTFVASPDEAKRAILSLWGQGFHELLLEPYCPFTEFTISVLENPAGKPTALIPIEMVHGGNSQGILDYRKKYLPTAEARYYCPPRFSPAITEEILQQAEKLFECLGLRDFVRIDGWVTESGDIYFSDLNPISGMEQNSLLFQQATRVGLTHTDLVQYILENALKRYQRARSFKRKEKQPDAEPVFILTGGESSERQVALMSGTNIWLKLFHSETHNPSLFLLDAEENVWRLPYHLALHHTVEEILEQCQRAEKLVKETAFFSSKIRQQLQLPSMVFQGPEKMDLKTFIEEAKKANAFVFLGLHGGKGESGELQKLLEASRLLFNGCNAETSALCMDKYLTAKMIEALDDPNILPMQQFSFRMSDDPESIWKNAVARLNSSDLIVKPQCDGCSTGVLRVRSLAEFTHYMSALKSGLKQLHMGSSIIELPAKTDQPYLLECFIHTDKIVIQDAKLLHTPTSGWCEMTVGVLEEDGSYLALDPSITVAENHVLSVEEKFQGGTGVNITPPPENLLAAPIRTIVQHHVCKAAKVLRIKNYSRIDLFVELKTGVIRLIEVNTLPALTPSTVFFHQALSRFPELHPKPLLAKIIASAKKSWSGC